MPVVPEYGMTILWNLLTRAHLENILKGKCLFEPKLQLFKMFWEFKLHSSPLSRWICSEFLFDLEIIFKSIIGHLNETRTGHGDFQARIDICSQHSKTALEFWWNLAIKCKVWNERKYLKETYYKQLSFKYFIKSFFIPKLLLIQIAISNENREHDWVKVIL